MQLGWVEELGSGVLNVSKYWQVYSKGTKPQFIEGATFKIVLPLNDQFFTGNEDGNQDGNQDAISVAVHRLIDGGVSGGVNEGVNKGVRKEIIELATVATIQKTAISEKKHLMQPPTPKAAGANLLTMKLLPGIKRVWILPG